MLKPYTETELAIIDVLDRTEIDYIAKIKLLVHYLPVIGSARFSELFTFAVDVEYMKLTKK